MSQWNHVAIERDGIVIDSNAGVGVAVSKLDDFKKRYTKTQLVKAGCPNEDAAWTFIKRQVGKSYDYRALLGLPFRRNWQHDSKFFCSELAALGLIRGGRKMKLPAGRVTPRDLWLAL